MKPSKKDYMMNGTNEDNNNKIKNNSEEPQKETRPCYIGLRIAGDRASTITSH